MLNVVKAKLAALVQAKIAVAVLATVVVAGGGTAVAATVTHGNLASIGAALTHTATHQAGDSSAPASQHLSVEGVLLSYTPASGSTSASISVQPRSGAGVTILVNANTRINGDAGQPSGGSQANGAQTTSLADLTAAVNHRVQVQADKTTAGWLASKVTIQAAEACAQDTTHGNSSQTDANGTPPAGSQPQSSATPCGSSQGAQEVRGAVKSIDLAGSSFVVTTANGDVTVMVSASTHFDSDAQGLAGLKTGASVVVEGTQQSAGTVAANQITVSHGDSSKSPVVTPGSDSHTPEPVITITPETNPN